MLLLSKQFYDFKQRASKLDMSSVKTLGLLADLKDPTKNSEMHFIKLDN